MALLNLQSVSKVFGEIKAVEDVSFTVDRGEVVGFLGPNGAGKSTTMRVITQFYEPDEGSVTFDGQDLAANTLEAKKRIGYLPENNPLYMEMLACEYLDFVARLRGIDGQERRDAIEQAVSDTGIEQVFYRPVGELSKGYKQRVGLAQAILHRPDLLILDEPTEGLDPNQRVGIRKLIAELGQERTVILSTHVLSEVQDTCSRLLIINNGRLAADGPTSTLLARAEGQASITVEAEGKGVAEGLATIPGVQDVRSETNSAGRTRATMMVAGEDDARPVVFNMARDKGWTLFELHQRAGSLEDLFRNITRAVSSEDGGEEVSE